MNKRFLSIIIALVMCISLASCDMLQGVIEGITGNIQGEDTPEINFTPNGKLLYIHYLDVGQGDSIFIELPNGKTMLIDASVSSADDTIIKYIKGQGVKKLDYVIATHPHADHIGAMAKVLDAFDIGMVYMPDVTANTKTFEKMLDVIEEKEIPVKRAKAGVTVLNADGVTATLLAPVSDEYSDMNDYSAVLRIEYGKRAFMFMGDATTVSEGEIRGKINCDVVKVGHHGSSSSSGEAFVLATGADYAVFSVGEGNDYGHPHKESLDRWKNSGAKILRTDIDGNIVVSTDGEQMSVRTRNGIISGSVEIGGNTMQPADTSQEAYNWVLNTNSKKIHKEDCSSVKDMSEKNKEFSRKSIEELEKDGYSPCGICKPEK